MIFNPPIYFGNNLLIYHNHLAINLFLELYPKNNSCLFCFFLDRLIAAEITFDLIKINPSHFDNVNV